jgi:hypothetical protein
VFFVPAIRRAARTNNLIAISSRVVPQRIVTASRKGCIHIATQEENEWRSESIDFPVIRDREAYQVVPLHSLGAFLIVRANSVDLVDIEDNAVLHTFETEVIQQRSLKCRYSSRRKPRCGSTGVAWLSLAYVSVETLDCVVHQYLPEEDGDSICFRNAGASASSTCCPWTKAREARKHIINPGLWEMLPNGAVVGVRSKSTSKPPRSGSSSPQEGGLRRRMYRSGSEPKLGQEDSWEVWVWSRQGRHNQYETLPLRLDDELGLGLMITRLGPMVPVGTSSVAVGFGNVIKLITVGHERFRDDKDPNDSGEAMLNLGSRRRNRPGGPSSRPRAVLRI